MYTSVVLFALAGFTSSTVVPDQPSWQTDYYQAKKQGMTEKKPVAVFIGSGKDGWNQLSRSGSLGDENTQILAGSYVCVYVDTATEEGKRLAQLFEVGGGVGLVISDRSGRYMAFHHEGDLALKDLTYYLRRYADPNRVFQTTETNPSHVTTTRSYYQPPQAPAPAHYWQPAFSGFSGRGC